jgi:hypothetical protein
VLLRTTETLTRLLDVCDEHLRDPDDPGAYTLATRADSIKVIYRDKDAVTGKPIQKTLQELLARAGFAVDGCDDLSPPPAVLMLQTMSLLIKASSRPRKRLLRDARIRQRVRRCVELSTEIRVREILGRLCDRARADITELLDEHGRFDLADIRNRGLGHLIKSVTVRQERTNHGTGDEEPRCAEVIRIELHDGQKSDETLGRYLGMERTPVNLSVNLSLDEQRQVNFLVNLVRPALRTGTG